MIILKSAGTLNLHLQKARAKGQTIGFVPTMGALHEGHISLVDMSKKQDNLCVCSIFVNPTQFNNPADFEKYPVTIERDIDMLEKSGCDILFMPVKDDIYPPGYLAPHYELGYLETVLEGKYRPGHFQGVCQVVDCLLRIVNPNNLYLGQKDYQQCMVIKKLVELTGNRAHIVVCPTLREPDGLAMSSRNLRLTDTQRKLAPGIFQILQLMKSSMQKGSLEDIKNKAAANLSKAGFKVDYADIADAETLELVDHWDGKRKLVALIAAFIDDIRLIDNLVLSN